jgi:hypothetical protein
MHCILAANLDSVFLAGMSEVLGNRWWESQVIWPFEKGSLFFVLRTDIHKVIHILL